MEKTKFQNNLKKIRLGKGLSQSQLAKKSGVNIRMVQYYEQGLFNFDNVTASILLRLAIALDCKLSDLLSGDSQKIALEYDNITN